jgi:exopolyphosphatase/guanosine-5'-triphosphate,3'-diphosphate pyrophosphatase
MSEHTQQAGPESVPGPVNGTVGGPLRVPGEDGPPPGAGGADPPGTGPQRRDREGGEPGAQGVVRVAAIDCGTNSLRLLIADVDPGRGTLTDVVRRMEIVRLGQGVDAAGRLAPAALERTLTVLREYAAVLEAATVGVLRMVATSATRDAANAADFVSGVKEIIGAEPDVLRGDQEAQLSFLGATAELAAGRAGQPAAVPPFLVTDIGGGSTEFVTGAGPDGPVAAVSMNVGCVRMTERHLRDDPPSPAQIAAATADIDAALAEAAQRVPVPSVRTLIGLAGSVTTVAGIALGLDHYDPARIHHSVISAADVHGVTTQLLGQTHAERARIGVMHPGRVDVIGGGALVLDRIMTVFGFGEVLVSEHDILDGIAWSLASGRWPG